MSSDADLPQKQHRYFRPRTFNLPTWRVVLPSLVLVAVVSGYLVKHAYGWLAVSEPLQKAPYLIVEGWLPDYALEESAGEIRKDHVTLAFCTGVPIDRGTLVYSFGSYAEYARRTLVAMKVPAEKLSAVPADLTRIERTRMMARALKTELASMDIPDARRRINLLTLGTHARRSRQVFQEELGSSWQVGVISLEDVEADPDRWYFQSASAKNVITETIALTMGMFGAN